PRTHLGPSGGDGLCCLYGRGAGGVAAGRALRDRHRGGTHRGQACAARLDGPHGGAMKIETLAVHAGLKVDETTGAVVPPIHAATTFEHEPDSTYPRGFLYSRSANPNRNALEECLAELEGGVACAAFASASAATAAVVPAPGAGRHG